MPIFPQEKESQSAPSFSENEVSISDVLSSTIWSLFALLCALPIIMGSLSTSFWKVFVHQVDYFYPLAAGVIAGGTLLKSLGGTRAGESSPNRPLGDGKIERIGELRCFLWSVLLIAVAVIAHIQDAVPQSSASNIVATMLTVIATGWISLLLLKKDLWSRDGVVAFLSLSAAAGLIVVMLVTF